MKKILLLLLCQLSLLVFQANAKSSINHLHKQLYFTENKGQVIDQTGQARNEIVYVGDAGGGTKIYFQKGKVSYVMSDFISDKAEVSSKSKVVVHSTNNQQPTTNNSQLTTHRIDLEFENSNPSATIIGENKTNYENYYLPQCKDGLTVNSFLKITYKDIYPNIDIVFSGNGSTPSQGRAGEGSSGLEYDFIINPGANPADIKIKYTGAAEINSDGQTLIIKTSIGEIREYIPESYQIIDGKKVKTAVSYQLMANSELTFKLSAFNSNYPLTIDPWVTYYGGTSDDYSCGIITDKLKNVIITGLTWSNTFPVSTGAFQTKFGGGTSPMDAFAVKFDPAGNLLWATYYGGSKDDSGIGVKADKLNNIVITGSTSSTNFPVSSLAFQTALSSAAFEDAFAIKLNGSNGNPLWATYLGGTDKENGNGIAVDDQDNVLITGETYSTNFPVTAGAVQTICRGCSSSSFIDDAFVAKLDGSNGYPIWATYYGGTSSDYANSVAVDNLNNVLITGQTGSTDFAVSAGVFQTSFAGGSLDVFVMKLDAGGNLKWATYYGGGGAGASGNEYGHGIITDHLNNVVITGDAVDSPGFPVSSGAFQSVFRGGTRDAYVVKLDSAGNRKWATYYGGTGFDEGHAVIVGATNDIFATGDTYSLDLPVTPCAYQTANAAGSSLEDNYLAHFDTDGNIICSGYIGGKGEDETWNSNVLASDGSNLYIAGYTKGNYPVTPNAWQTKFGGIGVSYGDVFVAQLCISACGYNIINTNFSVSGYTTTPVNLCIGSGADFKSSTTPCNGSVSFLWSFQGGIPSSSSVANPTGIVYNALGTYDVKLVVTTPCGTDSLTKTGYVTVSTPVTIVAGGGGASISGNVTICKGGSTTLSASATGGNGNYMYSWSPFVFFGTYSLSYIPVSPLVTSTYSVSVSNSCNNAGAAITVTVNPEPTAAFIYGPNVLCANAPVVSFMDQSIQNITNWQWNYGDNQSSVSQNPQHTYPVTGTYTIQLAVTDVNGCKDTAYHPLTIYPPLSVFVSSDTSVCPNHPVKLSAMASGGNGVFNYSWSPVNANISSITIVPSLTTIYTIAVSNAACGSITATLTVNVFPKPTADFTYSPALPGISEPVAFTDGSLKNIFSWLWNFGDNGSSDLQNPQHNYSDNGMYTIKLIVADTNGCIDSTKETITITAAYSLFVPSSFTPNIDGKNDVFFAYGNLLSEFEMKIFDRWGQLVFTSGDINKGWDGKCGNMDAQEDIYVWEVTYTDNNKDSKKIVGRVALIR